MTYAADPNAPGGYSQTTTLSPAEQALYDSTNKIQQGALGVGIDQLGRVSSALGTPLDTSGLPQLRYGHNFGEEVNRLAPGQITTSFDQGQPIQGDVGGDLNAARQQAIDAVYGQATSRLDPRFSQEENALRTRLANQGLSENSDAYKTALMNFQQGKNDAYNQAQYSAIGAGEDAANSLFGRQVQQGQFHNTAAGQQYTQNQGVAAFGNQAEAQRFGEDKDAAALQLQARIAAAQQNNTARQQALQERAYIQNEPINQLSSLLGMSQVSMPTGVQYTPSQVAPTDVLGAYALNQQGQIANAQAKQAASSGLMGGLFSLGSAALMASDARLKTDVRFLRRRKDGVKLYAYRYKWGGPERVGVIAQELKRVRPDLVVRGADGYLRVNYHGLEAA
ncbi:tail fiber domain-containing protein [Phenylobacterium soli]|uniref:Peptidase S74 domain-containing protein n=1 Tax=Phenylobacterium soli TaxID=2170551 RepID=A0A328A940_9CAUL|nr:tail fiber domain-containing protein [Phenylobacterium soli]RAK51193.1 hypothetical protein DJ017_19740 [Phenylobacterium soli]